MGHPPTLFYTMKFIKKIPNVDVDISLYDWNQKYLVKFEMGGLEQTYKVSQLEITTHVEVEEAITAEFINKVIHRFEEMTEDWDHTLGLTL
jgi:hypothetical protein